MKWKTIIVLAKSYKRGHWCIAGRELVENNKGEYDIHGWIRPVSSDTYSQGAIFDNHCQLNNGDQTSVLDIVRIPFDSHAPEPGQPENWLILEGKPWEKIDRYSPDKVKDFEDNPDDLWFEQGSETDHISPAYEKSARIEQSLNLIKPMNFYVALDQSYNDYKKKYIKRITAKFFYNEIPYKGLSITDPKVRKMLDGQYPAKGNDPKHIKLEYDDNYYLCVSLGPRFGYHNRHYKFVATIFDFDGYIQT